MEPTQPATQESGAEKIAKVTSAVSDAFNIHPKDLTNKEDRAFLVPRQVAAYFLKKAGETLKTIREALGLVIDGQVYQYCARVKQLTSTDATVRETVNRVGVALGYAPDNSPPLPMPPPNPKPAVPKVKKCGRPEKSARAIKRSNPIVLQPTPTVPIGEQQKGRVPQQNTALPKKVLEAVWSIYGTPALLTSPDPTETITTARQLAAFVLWTDYKIQPGETAALFAMSEESVYTLIGKAIVLAENSQDFGQDLSAVRSKIRKL